MNLFYDLPEDLLILIYKKYYSNHVLHELLTMPGNFVSWYNDYNCWFCGCSVVEKKQIAYRLINNIRVKSNDNLCFEIQRAFKQTFDKCYWYNLYLEETKLMSLIDKIGWERYKTERLARQEYLKLCFSP